MDLLRLADRSQAHLDHDHPFLDHRRHHDHPCLGRPYRAVGDTLAAVAECQEAIEDILVRATLRQEKAELYLKAHRNHGIAEANTASAHNQKAFEADCMKAPAPEMDHPCLDRSVVVTPDHSHQIHPETEAVPIHPQTAELEAVPIR